MVKEEMPPVIRKGKIMDFRGSWGSGIGYLIIKDSKTGRVESLTCENAETVRSLDAAFGGVISEEHTADVSGIRGREIYWGPGDWVGIGWFMPVEEAPFEMEEAYERQSRKKLKEVL